MVYIFAFFEFNKLAEFCWIYWRSKIWWQFLCVGSSSCFALENWFQN